MSDPFMDLKFMVYQVEYDIVHSGLHGATATEEADGAEFKELIGSLFVRVIRAAIMILPWT